MNTAIVANDLLLSALVTRQQLENLSDYRFARRLGVTRSLWQLTRTHRRAIGLTILKATIRTYPKLLPHVIEYLRDGNHAET